MSPETLSFYVILGILVLIIVWLWRMAEIDSKKKIRHSHTFSVASTKPLYVSDLLKEFLRHVQPTEKIYTEAEKEEAYKTFDELMKAMAYVNDEFKSVVEMLGAYSGNYVEAEKALHLYIDHAAISLIEAFKYMQVTCLPENSKFLVQYYHDLSKQFAEASWDIVVSLSVLENSSQDQEHSLNMLAIKASQIHEIACLNEMSKA